MIQLRPESPEELRKRLRDMSDLELRRFGQRARKLSDPTMNLGATASHVVELEERVRSGAQGILRVAQHETARCAVARRAFGIVR